MSELQKLLYKLLLRHLEELDGEWRISFISCSPAFTSSPASPGAALPFYGCKSSNNNNKFVWLKKVHIKYLHFGDYFYDRKRSEFTVAHHNTTLRKRIM